MPTPVLSLRDLNRALLARQLLLTRESLPVVDAIERLVGLQAQWPKPPFVGLWSRLDGFRREGLIDAVQGRQVVRATLMRATIHLMSAKDYATWRPWLQPSLAKGLARFKDRNAGIDPEALLALARPFLAAPPRTFEALRQHLTAHFPTLDERMMGHTVRMHLPLVQIPTAAPWGYPQTTDWALADDWTGKPVAADGDLGSEAVRRYLAAFGPASPQDMQTWTGVAGLKPLFEAARADLVTFRDDRNREVFDLPDAPRPAADTPAPVRFLPEFDNLVLGHQDRRRVVAEAFRSRLILPGLRVPATFLVDGMVAGTWTVEKVKKAAILSLTPFEPLAKQATADLLDEGQRLLGFVEPEAATADVRVLAP